MSKKVIHYGVRGKRQYDYTFDSGRRGIFRACRPSVMWCDTLPRRCGFTMNRSEVTCENCKRTRLFRQRER